MEMPIVDGFEAKEDLSSLSEAELSHRIINAVIWLAQERGHSVEEVLVSLLESHRVVKLMQVLSG